MFRWGILIICLFYEVPAIAAHAQRADRSQRLDRLDRAQDRISARDRIADRAIADRARDRTVTDIATRDVADETVRDEAETVENDAATLSREDSPDPGAIILDPFGDRIRRGEVLALNPSIEGLAELSRRNLREVRQRPLANDAVLYLFRSVGASNVQEVLETLQVIDPDGLYTPNHVFDPNGAPEFLNEEIDLTKSAPSDAACSVGLIDGPVQILPATLQQTIAKTRQFEPGPVSDSPHGAAVAFRLIETAEQLQRGDPISICAADVFSAGPDRAITAEAIASALHWQMAQEVDLINASLAGPHNAVVAWSVERFVAMGGTLVAAVGNGGPLSRNIYPAAYAGVVGVTAVDTEGQLYSLASQGAHVDIAARGVNINVSQIGIEDALSGTSFAAPIVTGWIAAHGPEFSQAGGAFIDRGAVGRDAKFGVGELDISRERIAQTSAIIQGGSSTESE